jgi:hypothetical protein
MFSIKGDLLWVTIQTREEPFRASVVLLQNQVQEFLKDEQGTLFSGHEGVTRSS